MEISQEEPDDTSIETTPHDAPPLSLLASPSSLPNANATASSAKQQARILLCLAHLFSEFSQWIWQFGIVVWLTTLAGDGIDRPSSLFLNSSYAATCQLCVILLVGKITSGMLHTARMKFTSLVILLQIPCILLATGLLGREIGRLDSHSLELPTLAAICVCGGLAETLQAAFEVAMKRDWIVAIAELGGDQHRWMEITNVFLKQIHVGCVIVGPSIAVALHSRGDLSSVLWVGCIRGLCLLMIHAIMRPMGRLDPSLIGQQVNINMGQHFHEERSNVLSSCGLIRNLREYREQEAVWAGVSMAFLYCNVMTFGGILVAYLKSLGMDWWVISVCQGVSNAAGLLGTCAFAISQRYFHVRTTATWGICWQFLFLTVSIIGVMVYRDNEVIAARIVIIGVIVSRVGLYVFDLAYTQFFQQTVPYDKRGEIGGTQTAMNSLFEVVPFILSMIFSDPENYWIVMMVSYISVGMAATLVVFGVNQRWKCSYTRIELVEFREAPAALT